MRSQISSQVRERFAVWRVQMATSSGSSSGQSSQSGVCFDGTHAPIGASTSRLTLYELWLDRREELAHALFHTSTMNVRWHPEPWLTMNS